MLGLPAKCELLDQNGIVPPNWGGHGLLVQQSVTFGGDYNNTVVGEWVVTPCCSKGRPAFRVLACVARPDHPARDRKVA